MFRHFASAVEQRIKELAADGPLFRVNVPGDELWQIYLGAFPEGTNIIFRERTEHDCQCCKSFIRNMGNVVGIDSASGRLRSIWDVDVPEPYQTVTRNLHAAVVRANIADLFMTREARFGAEHNYGEVNGEPWKFHHFHCEVPSRSRSNTPDAKRGQARTNAALIERSLNEITPEAVATVLGLIEEGSLYRGAQYQADLVQFQSALWSSLPRDRLAWLNYKNPAMLIRNTGIGTLLQDLSAGRDIESAVRAYEAIVSPQNYRRSSAPISKGMVTKAVDTLREMGLEPALERRHAVASDVSINAVLWANRSTKSVMRDTLMENLLAETTAKARAVACSTEINIREFLTEVLPSAEKLEVLFEHPENLMSVTAPVHTDAPPLFAWDNGFAWSYRGNVTDSIKERVKRAGGSVDGLVRVSLSWFNTDDLDLHVQEGNRHIYYGDKHPRGSHGKLDVDMNVAAPVRDAVENVTWDTLAPVKHVIWVENFTKRESIDVGFEIEFAVRGQPSQFLRYERAVPSKGRVNVGEFHEGYFKPAPEMVISDGSRDLYGLKTGQWQEVNMVMLSPNHWEKPKGNKHWFFILENCRADVPVRGIYNEFLRPALTPHRKVFEVLADKTQCPVAEQQLSGLGYSETIRKTLIVRVDGGRQYRVAV